MSDENNHIKILEKNETTDFDSYNINYNFHLGENLSQIPFSGNISYYAEKKIAIMKTLCPNPKTVLEFGCGIGRNIEYLIQYYSDANIFGYDISKKCIEYASNKYRNVSFFYSIDDLDKRRFDCIIVADVFHHIQERERDLFVKILFKILSKDGQIIFFEQNPFNPITNHLVKTCVFDHDAKLLSMKELSSILKGNNHNIKRYGYTFFFPEGLKSFDFLEKFLFWIPLGGKYFVLAEK